MAKPQPAPTNLAQVKGFAGKVAGAAAKAPAGTKVLGALSHGLGGPVVGAAKVAAFLLGKPLLLGVCVPVGIITYTASYSTWNAAKAATLAARRYDDALPREGTVSLFAGRAGMVGSLFGPELAGFHMFGAAASGSSIAANVLKRVAFGSLAGGIIQGSVLASQFQTATK